jgi:hypothetical protein
MSFGAYPEVSLSSARARLADVRAVLRSSGDPMAERRHARTTVHLSLGDAVAQYLNGRKDISDAYRQPERIC